MTSILRDVTLPTITLAPPPGLHPHMVPPRGQIVVYPLAITGIVAIATLIVLVNLQHKKDKPVIVPDYFDEPAPVPQPEVVQEPEPDVEHQDWEPDIETGHSTLEEIRHPHDGDISYSNDDASSSLRSDSSTKKEHDAPDRYQPPSQPERPPQPERQPQSHEEMKHENDRVFAWVQGRGPPVQVSPAAFTSRDATSASVMEAYQREHAQRDMAEQHNANTRMLEVRSRRDTYRDSFQLTEADSSDLDSIRRSRLQLASEYEPSYVDSVVSDYTISKPLGDDPY